MDRWERDTGDASGGLLASADGRQLIECDRSLTSAECAVEPRMAAQPPNAAIKLVAVEAGRNSAP